MGFPARFLTHLPAQGLSLCSFSGRTAWDTYTTVLIKRLPSQRNTQRANGILHQLPSGSQLTCNLSQDWPNLLATFYSADDCQAEQPVLTTRLHASLAFSSLSHPFLSVQNVLSPSLSLLLHHCYKSKAKSQPKCTWLPLVFHLPHDWKLSVSSYSLSTFSVLW